MAFADRLSCDRASVQLYLRQDLASNALRDLRNRSRDSDTAAALHLFQCWLSAHMYSAEDINPAPVPAHLAVASTTTMTILLANTWAPGTGALEPSVVPRYLCALVSALLDAGARVRFILRRTEDASALQVAFGNAAWEASVVPAADDVLAIERAACSGQMAPADANSSVTVACCSNSRRAWACSASCIAARYRSTPAAKHPTRR
jgi:hypothetical protein